MPEYTIAGQNVRITPQSLRLMEGTPDGYAVSPEGHIDDVSLIRRNGQTLVGVRVTKAQATFAREAGLFGWKCGRFYYVGRRA